MPIDMHVSISLDPEVDDGLDLVRQSARQLLATEYPASSIREAASSDARYLTDFWEKVAKLGWPGILIPTELGGAEASVLDAGVLAEEMGAALCQTPFVPSSVVAARLLVSEASQTQQLLESVAKGAAIASLIQNPSGRPPSSYRIEASSAGYRIEGSAAFVPYAHVASELLVTGQDTNGDDVLLLVSPGSGGVRMRIHDSIDWSPLCDVTFDEVEIAEDRLLATGPEASSVARDAQTLGAVVRSMERIGGARRCLEIASDYAMNRVQFGRPIATFQAIKHRLADMYVSLILAKSISYAALRSAVDASPSALLASMATVVSAEAFTKIARSDLQIHGGLGYTWETDAHLYLRRAAALANLDGSRGRHLDLVGQAVSEMKRTRAGSTVADSRSEPDAGNTPEVQEHHQSGIRLGESDRVFQQEWSEWLDKTLPPRWGGASDEAWHEDPDRAAVARSWRRKLRDDDWAAIAWPREYGGREASVLQQVIFKEELIARGVLHGLIRIATNEDNGGRAATAIMEYGTPEQQELFIPKILTGEITFCQGFSEPDAGSDLAGLKTRAVKDGDDFTVNGQKIWTGDAHLADWMYMLVRTDLDAPKHRGISYLLVDMKSEGIDVRGIRDITGGQRVNEVFFDDVRVPTKNLVGQLNQGWLIARSTLQVERSGLFNTNLLDNMLGSVVRLAQKTTVHDGRTAWEDDELRRRLARDAITVNSVKQLGYSILVQQMRGTPLGAEPSVGKLAGSELRQGLTETSMEILGELGVLGSKDELAVNKGMAGYAYIIERGATIGGGTSEMQRNAIAEKGLGLPKD